MILGRPLVIRSDSVGDGRWWSSRTAAGVYHPHLGVDYLASAGADLLAPEAGTVTEPGYPYADTRLYRIVNMLGASGLRWAFFYALPSLLPSPVLRGARIGTVQDVAARYGPACGNHVHVQVRAPRGGLPPVGCPTREWKGSTWCDPDWCLREMARRAAVEEADGRR